MSGHGHTDTDASMMRRALQLAELGPVADPNPRVGAVVVGPAGHVVGEGFHRGAGSAHAEVAALAMAGDQAVGGTAFVSLEPCNHTGRTGPCSRALLDSGVTRVVYAQPDPSGHAAGGAATLRAAGVQVDGGLLAHDAEVLNQAWTFAVLHARPRVTWKFASTLDGRSAAADGTSQWITGPAARADVHELRATAGAILVGTGTILADDPSLTVRHPDGSQRMGQPLRVVMGRRPIPDTARVLDDSARTLRLTDRDPIAALKVLAKVGVRHVWLEGGPTLAAAFLAVRLVDEVVAYLSPTLLGAGRTAVSDFGVNTIDGALRLLPHDVTCIGPDIRLRASIDYTKDQP